MSISDSVSEIRMYHALSINASIKDFCVLCCLPCDCVQASLDKSLSIADTPLAGLNTSDRLVDKR